MEKLVYLLFDEVNASGLALRTALIEKAAPALRSAGAREIRVNVDAEHVADGKPIRKSVPVRYQNASDAPVAQCAPLEPSRHAASCQM